MSILAWAQYMLILLKLSVGAPTDKEQQQIDKITAFLKENNQPYMVQGNQGDYEVPEISLGNIIAEIDDAQAFIAFLAQTNVEKHQICIIPKISYIRGDGKELCEIFPYKMTLNEFTQKAFGQRLTLKSTNKKQ